MEREIVSVEGRKVPQRLFRANHTRGCEQLYSEVEGFVREKRVRKQKTL